MQRGLRFARPRYAAELVIVRLRSVGLRLPLQPGPHDFHQQFLVAPDAGHAECGSMRADGIGA
jgi:hypothetical protein